MSNNKKKVLVSGNFNVIHPGHLRLLRFAKECGDHLIVGIESDKMAGKNAYVHESLRLEGVLSNSWVDEAIIVDEPIVDFIKNIRPDIVVKGKEFQLQSNPEEEIMKLNGGELIFSSGETIFSSFDLLKKEFQGFGLTLNIPNNFYKRHGVEVKRLTNLIENFKDRKVCVIGDLIIDEYITCEPLGMSQEEPTLVVTPIDSTKFIGGAGIVASHASGLGSESTILSVKGKDKTGVLAEKLLEEAEVNTYLVEDDNRPTTLKQRFRSKGKSLLRVSHLNQESISKSIQNQLYNKFKTIVDDIDLLVFSDFNYGSLPQGLVDSITELAKSKNKFLAADSQSSSQIGNISRFTGMDIITPTEREARISLNNYEDGLVVLAEQLRQNSNSKNILLKLGEEGLLIHANNTKDGESWLTDRVNALNLAPRDVAGAGDSLLIASILSFASGGNIWESSVLGSLAAAIQVGRVGNTPLKADELLSELSK